MPGASRFLPRGPVLDAGGRAVREWERFFRELQSVPLFLGRLVWNNGESAIAGRVLVTDRLQPGVYRLTYYARIQQAATTSSQLTVTFSWTDGGVAQTRSGALMNGNTTTTIQQDQILIRVDTNTNVTLSTTRASVGATPMTYNLDITLERVLGEDLRPF